MSDDAIINAINKREDLQNRIIKAEESIKRARAQITEITKFIKQWEKFSGRTAEDVASAKLLSKNKDFHEDGDLDKAEAAVHNPKKEEVAEAVVDILRERGRSMSRSELFQVLKDHGVRLYGSNPEMVLSTMLWRTRDAFGISRLRSGGYVLAGMAAANEELDPVEDDILEEHDPLLDENDPLW